MEPDCDICSSPPAIGGRCLRFGGRRWRRRRDLDGGGGGADRAGDRRPVAAGGDLPDVGPGIGGLRLPLLPQPVLLVPQRAPLHHRHLRPGRRRAPRPSNGGGAP